MAEPTSSWVLLVDPGPNWQIGVDNGIWAIRKVLAIRPGAETFFWGTKGRGFQGWGVVAGPVESAKNSELPFVDAEDKPYDLQFPVRFEDDSLHDPISWTELQEFLDFARGANIGPMELDSSRARKLRRRLMPSGWTQFGV